MQKQHPGIRGPNLMDTDTGGLRSSHGLVVMDESAQQQTQEIALCRTNICRRVKFELHRENIKLQQRIGWMQWLFQNYLSGSANLDDSGESV